MSLNWTKEDLFYKLNTVPCLNEELVVGDIVADDYGGQIARIETVEGRGSKWVHVFDEDENSISGGGEYGKYTHIIPREFNKFFNKKRRKKRRKT